MPTLDAHKAISARFAAEWGMTTPVAWPNTVFKEPDEAYARFYIKDGQSRQRSPVKIDNKSQFRATGLIVVQISVPANTGDGEAQELADKAAAIFRNKKFSGVWSLTPSVVTVGQVGDRYQINMTCPFQIDELL